MKTRSYLFLAVLTGSHLCEMFSSAKDDFSPSRNPFSALMDAQDIPQFVILTIDDPITTYSMSLFRPLTEIRDRYGCGIRSTFYVSIKDQTECNLVNALRQGRHEIATNTYSDVGNPSMEEIRGAIDHLNEQCGVPIEEMRGFRAPGLESSEETLQHLLDLGLEYDSSMVTVDHRASNFGRNHIWPWTFDEGMHRYTTCDCQLNVTDNGLWEVPLWSHFDSENVPLLPMDYPGVDPITNLLQANFERRYNGNRAPMGIFLHAGWLQQHNNDLKQWIEQLQQKHDDVHFITTHELIEWMRNPVKKRRFRQWCTDQESKCFTPIPLQCVFGEFNKDTCECECHNNYCKDADGLCTRSNGCNDVDGGWSDWEQEGSCCGGLRLLRRTCTNPAPAGNGADCEGDSTMTETCSVEECPRGGWGEWMEWGECCGGQRTRSRECLASPAINQGRGCIGDEEETESCGPDTCRKYFYPNTELGLCQRLATPPEGVDASMAMGSYQECCRENFNAILASCFDKSSNPPVDGGWSEWFESGPCCSGKQIIRRTCTEPSPAHGGEPCDGSDTKEQQCRGDSCTNGGWGEWSDFGECCDRQTTRTRECLAAPNVGCVGKASESIFCARDDCTKIYVPNFNLGKCVEIPTADSTASKTFKDSDAHANTQFRYSNGHQCCDTHFNWNYEACIATAQLPVDGAWGEWSGYGLCCKGIQSKYRSCNKPSPANGGLECEGPAIDTRSCSQDECGSFSSATSHISSQLIGFLTLLLALQQM